MTPEKLRGLALLIGMMYATDLFSAYMSSPWSTEAFGADEERAASARRLVGISVGTSLIVTGAASVLDRTPWTFIGGAAASAMMWYLYEQALTKGQAKGYQGVNLAQQGNGQ